MAVSDVLEARHNTAKDIIHPELLLEHDEGVGSWPELAPLAKQATDAATELHS